MQVYTNKCCREAVKTSDRKKTTVILQPGPVLFSCPLSDSFGSKRMLPVRLTDLYQLYIPRGNSERDIFRSKIFFTCGSRPRSWPARKYRAAPILSFVYLRIAAAVFAARMAVLIMNSFWALTLSWPR